MLHLKVSAKNLQTVSALSYYMPFLELTHEDWDEIQRIANRISKLDGTTELQSYDKAYLQFVISGRLNNGFCTD
jgi:hypothetical protein